jgi:hypothetical protein
MDEGADPLSQELYRVQVSRGMTFTQAIELFAFAEEFRSMNFRNKEELELVDKLRLALVEEKVCLRSRWCLFSFPSPGTHSLPPAPPRKCPRSSCARRRSVSNTPGT